MMIVNDDQDNLTDISARTKSLLTMVSSDHARKSFAIAACSVSVFKIKQHIFLDVLIQKRFV